MTISFSCKGKRERERERERRDCFPVRSSRVHVMGILIWLRLPPRMSQLDKKRERLCVPFWAC